MNDVMLRRVALRCVLPSLAFLLCVEAATTHLVTSAPATPVDPESGKLLFVDKAVPATL